MKIAKMMKKKFLLCKEDLVFLAVKSLKRLCYEIAILESIPLYTSTVKT